MNDLGTCFALYAIAAVCSTVSSIHLYTKINTDD